jgi:zinc protease
MNENVRTLCVAGVLLLFACAATAIELRTLPNGLRVVLATDASAPLVHVGVYYAVGPRQEPPGRAGFAHLFEHLMFEGSPHLKSGEYFDLVTSNGGRFGARTLYDLTKYNAMAPSNVLELLLWAEADRMSGSVLEPARFENTRQVVKNEVRQLAFERPYGRFVWIDIPEFAQMKWVNAHSIYGDTPDRKMDAIDAATIEDARAFFRTYYSPDNAVLVVTGDFDPARALRWIERYFSPIPRGAPRPRIDHDEPRQEAERRVSRIDEHAPRPAVAVAYHMPSRGMPDFWVMQIIDQILIEGRDSRMYESLVRGRLLTDGVSGGVSARHGSIYTTGGPNFWTVYVMHDAAVAPEALLAAVDEQLARVRNELVDAATLRRAVAKARADFLAEAASGRGDGWADLLGQFTLFDGDPHRAEQIESIYAGVTAEMVQAVAREVLRPENRTVLLLRTKESR